MKAIRTFLVVNLLLGFIVAAGGQQYQMPQDYWTSGDLHIDGSFDSIAVGPDGNLYASTGASVSVYDRAGVLLGQRGTNLNIQGIGLDSATNLYVLDGNGSNVVFKYSVGGNLIRTFAAYGTNDDQVIPSAGPPSALAIGSNDQVYVLDAGNKRIQVYDSDGHHLFQWGGYAGDAGGILGRFSHLEGIAAMPNGDIAVQNGWKYSPSSGLNLAWEIQLFNPSGIPLTLMPRGEKTAYLNKTSRAVAATPDGLLAFTHSYYYPPGGYLGFLDVVQVFPGDVSAGDYQTRTHSTAVLRSDGVAFEIAGIAFDGKSTVYISYFNGKGIHSARRYFQGGRYSTNAPPLPYILSTQQRANSTLVDIDYRVVSGIGSNTDTGLLVFVNNGNDLGSLRIPHLFVEGTAINIGINRPGNTTYRVTWDASEVATNFSNLQFEALAKDDRGLLPWSFVTVPASQAQTNFTMSRTGVLDSDLLSIWYWLLATNHPAITLTNGDVRLVAGTHDQLATGTGTTPAGRTFLYEILHVRAPTSNEIARAQSGNFGFASVSANNVVKLP